MENFSVHRIKYAESVLPESMVFDGGSKDKNIPISFVVYLIKSSDKNILVDAGCDTLPSFDMKKIYSPAFIFRCFDFCYYCIFKYIHKSIKKVKNIIFYLLVSVENCY